MMQAELEKMFEKVCRCPSHLIELENFARFTCCHHKLASAEHAVAGCRWI